jgi:hypothetical protein
MTARATSMVVLGPCSILIGTWSNYFNRGLYNFFDRNLVKRIFHSINEKSGLVSFYILEP